MLWEVGFDGLDAGDRVRSEAIDECVNEFAPGGLGCVFCAGAEGGAALLLVAEACGAPSQEEDTFDSLGEIGAFEPGAHERPEVLETAAGAAERDGDEIGRGMGAAEFDFETTDAAFMDGELGSKIFEDEA